MQQNGEGLYLCAIQSFTCINFSLIEQPDGAVLLFFGSVLHLNGGVDDLYAGSALIFLNGVVFFFAYDIVFAAARKGEQCKQRSRCKQ